MKKSNIIIIGTGFSDKAIGRIIRMSEEKRENEPWVTQATLKTRSIGFIKHPQEIKFTEEEVKNAMDAYGKRLEEIAKDFSNKSELGFERTLIALQNLSVSFEGNIERVKDLSVSFEDMKPKYMYDKPKSKYINKPRNNYKKR